MRYGIVINLDYENHPYKTVKGIYQAIEERLVAAGFRKDGRLFTIEADAAHSCDLARSTIEKLADTLALSGSDLYLYVREFYGFELSKATNLLLPSSDDIGVLELENVEDVEIIQLVGAEH